MKSTDKENVKQDVNRSKTMWSGKE